MERLLNLKEAAQILGVSIHTLNNWKSQRRITFIKIGRRTMFASADLEKMVESGKVKARHFA